MFALILFFKLKNNVEDAPLNFKLSFEAVPLKFQNHIIFLFAALSVLIYVNWSVNK